MARDIKEMKVKDLLNEDFGEIIGWNYQTSMYYLLVKLFKEIDDTHLYSMKQLYKREGNLEYIVASMEEALIGVLKEKV